MKNKTLINRLYTLLIIFLITFLPIFFVYLPFLLKLNKFFFLTIKEPGFANILKNWDGPSYVMVAKTLYNMEEIGKLLFSPLPHEYFTSHFPLFPLLIRGLTFFLDYFKSGLLINLVFGYLLNLLFYKIIKKYTQKPLFLTFVFTIFPARFWVVRNIIAPENIMLFLILLSFYLWDKKKYFLSSFLGFLGVLTKIQALFLFPAYLGEIIEKKFVKKEKMTKSCMWIFLIPLAFMLLSFFYHWKVGNFFIFLKAEGQNKLSFSFPFSQFNYQNTWGGTGWLEDVVLYFVAMFLLTISLAKNRNRSWFYFSLFYTIFLVFIPQRDITRFTYPLLPFFLIQFEKFLTSKTFKIAFFLSLPALYFYTINFILVNQAPIADWSKLLH
jgi:hypothetical protein